MRTLYHLKVRKDYFVQLFHAVEKPNTLSTHHSFIFKNLKLFIFKGERKGKGGRE